MSGLARVSEGSHARRSVLASTIRTRLTNSALEVVTGPPGTHIGPPRLGLYTHVGDMVGSGGQVRRAVGSVTLTVGSVSSSIPEKHISEKSFSCRIFPLGKIPKKSLSGSTFLSGQIPEKIFSWKTSSTGETCKIPFPAALFPCPKP